MKEKRINLVDSKQLIRFSLIKLLLQKRTHKQSIPESELSKNLNIIK